MGQVGGKQQRGKDRSVESKREDKALRDLLRGFAFGAGLKCFGRHQFKEGVTPGRMGYFSKGCVTMLMLVMPARLTDSMTVAKAPNGTRSSART